MGPTVSWDALRVFLVVYRAGSISAAADEMGMAQSSVSEQIARLERSLGYPLLNRSPAGVRATERGYELITRIAAPMDALAVATASETCTDSVQRTVFLGGPADFLSTVILPHLPAMLPDNLQVSAQFGQAENLLNNLRSGSVDVLVSTLPARGADLSSEPIYDEEFVLVAHPDFADSLDLTVIPVLSYGPELPIIRRYWRSVFGHRPNRLNVKIIAPDLRTLVHLACSGAGMTVLPDYLVQPRLDTGELIALHKPEVAPLNTLYVATRQPRDLPDTAIMAVKDTVAAIARQAG